MNDTGFIDYYNVKIKGHNWAEILEERLASTFGVKYALTCSSGTAAIHCALLSLDIQEGDEVLVPNLTVMMTIMPILYQKAIPVFVDCSVDSIDFDYHDLKNKVTNKTKAIIPVYMWGIAYNIDKLVEFAKEYNLKIIEDACQAQGSMWKNKYLGTFGDVGCFSLKDGKVICSGEGGYVLTNNHENYSKIKKFRNHQINKYPKLSFHEIGYNYRLSDIQAYIALNSLDSFLDNLNHRKMIVYKFKKNLPKLKMFNNIVKSGYNYFSPVFIIEHGSNKLLQELSEMDIKNSVGTFGLESASKKNVIINYYNKINFQCNLKTTNSDELLEKLLAITIYNEYGLNKVTKDCNVILKLLNEVHVY